MVEHWIKVLSSFFSMKRISNETTAKGKSKLNKLIECLNVKYHIRTRVILELQK